MAFPSNFEDTVQLVTSGDKTAGTVALVGDLLGCWMNDSLSGAINPLKIVGRVDAAPKTTSQVWVAGEPLYFDGTNFTNVANGNRVAGVVAEAAISAATAGSVILLPGMTIEAAESFSFRVPLLAASVDIDVFVANRACKVTAFRTSHSVVGGAAAAVRPRKITDTTAPGAAASATCIELTASIGLETAINTTRNIAITATAAEATLAAGERLALDFSGTLTGLVGQLTIEIQYL